jgi:hypothetical protein
VWSVECEKQILASAAAVKSALMAAVETTVKSAAAFNPRYRPVTVTTKPRAIASAENPGSAKPYIPVAGAGRNVSPDYRAADCYAEAGATVSPAVSAHHRPFIPVSKAAFRPSEVLTCRRSTKIARRGVGDASSEQASNQSSSEHQITNRVSHGNLPSVLGV